MTIPATPHALFGEGHSIFERTIREEIYDRLRMKFPSGDDWFNKGVLPLFDGDWQEELLKNQERFPNELVQAIHIKHFRRIYQGHHDSFATHLSNVRKNGQAFGQIHSARNSWAHPEGASQDVWRKALADMAVILESLKCHEAVQIRELADSARKAPDSFTTDSKMQSQDSSNQTRQVAGTVADVVSDAAGIAAGLVVGRVTKLVVRSSLRRRLRL